MSLFDPIRKSGQPITFSKAIIHFVLISCLGLITGVLISCLIFTQLTLEISFHKHLFGFLFAH